MNHIKAFNEASYNTQDIPKKFYLSADMSQIANSMIETGVLTGVKGISGSRENIADHMTNGDSTRKFLLVMDGAETVQLNKLSRVMYNNSKYLASDDLNALRRLYMHDSSSMTMYNITTELRFKIRDEQHKGMLNVVQSEVANQILNSNVISGQPTLNRKVIDSLELKTKPFRNEMQLVNAYGAFLKIPQPEMWKPWLHGLLCDVITKLAKAYEHEAEWRVKDELLRLPSSTRVYITTIVGMAFKTEVALWKQHYKVYTVDTEDLSAFRQKIHSKRSY